MHPVAAVGDDEADRSRLRTRALTDPIRVGDVRRYAREVRSILPKRLAAGSQYLVLIGVMLAFVTIMMMSPMADDLFVGDADLSDLGIVAIVLVAPLTVLALWVWVFARLIRQDRRRSVTGRCFVRVRRPDRPRSTRCPIRPSCSRWGRPTRVW